MYLFLVYIWSIRVNDQQLSPETIEHIPKLIDNDDKLTCSLSLSTSLIPQSEDMLMLKNTYFTELSSSHKVSVSNSVYLIYILIFMFSC